MDDLNCPWINTKIVIHRLATDPFFNDGNKVCQLYSKQLNLDILHEEDHRFFPTFYCTESGCSESFQKVVGYEVHYNSVHKHACPECRKILPSSHLLGIHMTEMHDSYFSACVEKPLKNLFSCLVQQCQDKFDLPMERRKHMINIHKYPSNYKYFVLFRTSIKKDHMDTSDPGNNNKNCSTKSKSKQPVPRTICFGQGSSRAFYDAKPKKKGKKKPWNQNLNENKDTIKNIEDVPLHDLKSTLMEISETS